MFETGTSGNCCLYGITSCRNAMNVYVIQKHLIAADDAYICDNLNLVTCGITSCRNAMNVYVIQKHLIAADDAYICDNLNLVTCG